MFYVVIAIFVHLAIDTQNNYTLSRLNSSTNIFLSIKLMFKADIQHMTQDVLLVLVLTKSKLIYNYMKFTIVIVIVP